MRISRLSIKNVGPFDDATFELPPGKDDEGEVVLFEGPNGSGKTTIAELIAFLIGAPPTLIGQDEVLTLGKVDGIGRRRGVATCEMAATHLGESVASAAQQGGGGALRVKRSGAPDIEQRSRPSCA